MSRLGLHRQGRLPISSSSTSETAVLECRPSGVLGSIRCHSTSRDHGWKLSEDWLVILPLGASYDPSTTDSRAAPALELGLEMAARPEQAPVVWVVMLTVRAGSSACLPWPGAVTPKIAHDYCYTQ